ncbi:MAG: TonB-dependent receptor plug domain-containing protein [Tannerella sp.]|jgi:TonB-dependent SusC/RagA subfamily outer membrane receptor|nr:TonB-dependent receptor plug domain-containing protein [Tannerella sp.]
MKKSMLTVWFLALSLFVLRGQTAHDDLLWEIATNFENQLATFPQEKLHVHTDRDVYVSGEKIWFRAYVTDAATLMPETESRYVYVELIDSRDSLVNRVMIRRENGMFCGYMPLNEIVPDGDYTLRAYTKYMENKGDDFFFKKNIRIGNIGSSQFSVSGSRIENEGNGKKKEIAGHVRNDESGKVIAGQAKTDFDVSFFPEGGNLVEGAFCKVAFKALNSKGYSEAISGELIDENGTVITNIETFHAGMGAFSFMPKQGKRYMIKCRNTDGLEKQFELPNTERNAISLTVTQHNNRITVGVLKTIQTSLSPYYLLAHCRGAVFHFSSIKNLSEPIAFQSEDLPEGVLQLILLDEQMNPLSERLVFNKNHINEKLDFKTDKPIYEKREKVTVTIKPPQAPPEEGQAPSLSERVGVRCSIAITDDKDIPADSTTTILSTLLLSSELKGYIENPAYYLQDNIESAVAMDLLMLTHGWRRYNIPEVVKGNYEDPQIPFEKSQTISGLVKSQARSLPVADGEVLMMAKNGDTGLTATDIDGRFVFRDFEYPDSTSYFIQALNKRGGSGVELAVERETFPKLVYAPQNPVLDKTVDALNIETLRATSLQPNDFIIKAEQRSKYDEAMRMIYLNEVEVTAPKIRKDEPRLEYWMNKISDFTIRKEDFERTYPTFVADILRRFSSARVDSNGAVIVNPGPYVPLALILIDGVAVEWPEELNTPFDSPLETVNVNEVESIDILKNASSAMFGSRGAGGVISITTKKGPDIIPENETPNTLVYTPLGYQKPVEFYSPKYDTPEAKQQSIPDYRTTIYWKPDLIIESETGEASFEFYTSGFSTTYSVVIEGIMNDGTIIRQVEKIRVK